MFGITRAPDFDRAGLDWLNVIRPLSLSDLKGRLVILDFWTFCCINCFHVLPTLKRIEEGFPNDVAVIGVHSPKFDHERDLDALAAAVERYGVTHPVVHDPHMVLWDEYCIRAWPTLVLISPDGWIIGQIAGEPNPDMLLQGVGDMVRQFWERGEMGPAALPRDTAGTTFKTNGRLRFPGKIKPCPLGDGRKGWAIADTGHNQIVVVDDDGAELHRYGTGTAGFEDGAGATFNGPEGLACEAAAIYVADTRNHAIRRIDRSGGQVTTLAGIGVRGTALSLAEPGGGTALASPWDLELMNGQLLFANAGTHQIGVLDLDTGMVRALAGGGGEAIVDGCGEHAMLAQPSGLALSPDGTVLYFADSETSAVRRLALEGTPLVETIVGAGLFDFGHDNGTLAEARLQHPLGLTWLDGKRLVVADSYNGTLRLIDLGQETVSDLDLCGEGACEPLSEPAGIASDGAFRLLVSDTNNHRIVEVRLDTGTVTTWLR
jgi:sugar lactone lactonase YvrE/thiol-disulfide isomerase/thioredoxin